MPSSTVFSEDFLEISVDTRHGVLDANWKGYQSVESIRTGCEATLKHMSERRLRKVLNDNTNMLGIWRSASEWVATDWFPRMKQADLAGFAWVYSSSRLSQISAEETLAKMDSAQHGVKVFYEKTKAEEWLISLPLETLPGEKKRPRVLVIEDNRDFSILFSDMLQVMGCETSVTYTAESALEFLQAGTPDMIFCDLSLPGNMDGFAFAQAVRLMEDARGTPLIAVSGRTAPEDQDRALKAGFDRVFAKPVKFGQVSKALEEFSEGRFFSSP